MAASGSFNTSGYEGRYLQFSWTETSQSVTNNTTTIKWTLKGAGAGDAGWYYCQNVKVVIDGAVVYNNATQFKLYEGTVVASGEYTMTHDNTGARSFTASAEAGIYVWAVNCTGSGSWALDSIARASQPSCITWPEHTQNVGYFGDTISIHMNRHSSAFTHTVRYAFGSRSGTIATNVGTGTTWTIPESLMELLPAVTSGSGTIYVDTYNGATKIGTKSCGFTAKVPDDVVPSCSLTLEDVTGVDDTYGSPVKGLSKIKVTVAFTAAYGSGLASCKITANGTAYNGTTATTGLLSYSGSSVVTAKVTDKRGRTATASYTMTVQDYSAPAVTALTVQRCDSSGTINDQGEYIKVTFSARVSSLSGKNTAAYAIKYKKSTAASYTTVARTALANTWTVNGHSYIFAADESSSYDVQATATDRHSTATRSTSASTAFSLMDWHASGTGIRFGGVAEASNLFRVSLPATFDADTVYEKDLTVRGNRHCFSSPGTAGSAGFVHMVKITLTAANADTPLCFTFTRRTAPAPMRVYVSLTNSSLTTSTLRSITYEGDNYGAFLVKESATVWNLYVEKASAYDTIGLSEWTTSEVMTTRVSLTFPGDLVAEVPDPYYRATPAKLESLLDHIYPVGSIYLAYNHTNPADLFGGTWARLNNTLLWATTATGTIGQTGTMHTPSAGTSWTYTQISAWRRTA